MTSCLNLYRKPTPWPPNRMSTPEQQQRIAQFGADHVVETLEPFVSESRKQRINAVIDSRLHSIQLAIECPSDINNALAAVRTCEAMGIGHIHIINPEGHATSIRPVTQGAFYWVDLHFHQSLSAFLTELRKTPVLLAGGSLRATHGIAGTAIDQPLCIIVGNEQRGLSPEAENACDIRYKIPMYGMTESLNLSVSAAISLYDTTTRKRQQLAADGDLNSAEKQTLRAKYYLHSVNQRIVDGLL